MKITRKEGKFILGSTVVDSAVLNGTAGLEKQLLTNALNLLKFPQRFGLTQDKGKELKFTSDIEQSGKILDVFSDAVWEYNPKTTVYEKKGKLSEVFNNKSIIFNEKTGKTYYLKDGEFKKISDLNFKVSRGDEVVRELEERVQDVESRMGDSGNRFSIVSALPANPDKDTLYIVIGEGQIDDSDVTGLDLSELQAKVSECITDNLNTRTVLQEMVSDNNTQNEQMRELTNLVADKVTKSEVNEINSRVTVNEGNISDLTNNLNTLQGEVNTKYTTHETEISDIKTQLENLASSETLVQLTNRVQTNENSIEEINGKVTSNTTDISDIKGQLENLASSETLVNLTSRVETNETNISNIQTALDTLEPADIAGLEEFIQSHENNGNIKVVSQIPEEPEEDTLYIISNEGEPFTLTSQDIVEIRQGINNNSTKINALESSVSALDTKITEKDTTLKVQELESTIASQRQEIDELKALVSTMKSKLDLIGFDTVELGGVPYNIVVKSE